MLKRYRLLIVNVVLLMALAGSMYGKRIEMANVKKTEFLRHLDLPFRDWKYDDQPLTQEELKLLTPDDWTIRLYHPQDRNGKPDISQQIQLAVIAGHRKQSVHTPDFCMQGTGLDTITQQSGVLRVGDEEIPMSRSVMARDGRKVVLTYFFTDGRTHTSSLTRFQLNQLVKRFGSGIPLGALVRFFTPVRGDGDAFLKEADDLTLELANAALPKVLKAMRETKLEAN